MATKRQATREDLVNEVSRLTNQLIEARDRVKFLEEMNRTLAADTNWWKDLSSQLGDQVQRWQQMHRELLTQVAKQQGPAHLREYTKQLQDVIERSAPPVGEFQVALALAGRNTQGIAPQGVAAKPVAKLEFIDVGEE